VPFFEGLSFARECLLGDANQKAGTSSFKVDIMVFLPLHLLSILIRWEQN